MTLFQTIVRIVSQSIIRKLYEKLFLSHLKRNENVMEKLALQLLTILNFLLESFFSILWIPSRIHFYHCKVSLLKSIVAEQNQSRSEYPTQAINQKMIFVKSIFQNWFWKTSTILKTYIWKDLSVTIVRVLFQEKFKRKMKLPKHVFQIIE